METLELRSFDGTTLLGFLASVGALRLLDAMGDREVRLAFDEATGHARIRSPSGNIRARLEQALSDKALATVWTFINDEDEEPYRQPSDFPSSKVATHLAWRLKAKGVLSRTFSAEALGALVAGEPTDKGNTESTELRAVGGGQLQYFKQITGLFDDLTAENIASTLDAQWAHQDKAGGLRLAPEEDRSYALRSSDPSTEGAVGERAANLLALCGHVFFPVLPQGSGATVGFDSKADAVQWPVWSQFAGVATVRALVCLCRNEADDLQRRGVFRVMKAGRVTRGRYRNFSPALAVW